MYADIWLSGSGFCRRQSGCAFNKRQSLEKTGMNSILKVDSQALLVLVILLLLPGCTLSPIYTSKDLARLPCESTASKFFYPVEFDADGDLLYEDQLQAARTAASTSRDIIIFVHGWDKTTGSAENDYQDFLCRLYWRGVDSGHTEETQTIVIGVFWPSTVFPNYEDFPLIKPFTYYIIKDRADRLAIEGIRKRLLPEILDLVEHDSEKRLHVVGHSFGGRMLIWAVSDYFRTRMFAEVPQRVSAINFVLLLPAIEPSRGKLDLAQMLLQLRQSMDKVDGVEGVKSELFRVFIVCSERDWANHFLFPISQALSLKIPSCSIGACGEPSAPTLTVDEAGNINKWVPNSGRVWNIKADSIISSHSDIYKGRIAGLIWRLITAKELTPNDLKAPLSLVP